MKRYNAFTLMEITVAMMLIGIFAIAVTKAINLKEFDAKTSAANAYKVFDVVQQASSKIRATESEQCPSGLFLDRVLADNTTAANPFTYEYGLYDTNGTTLANTRAVLKLFGNHLRFEQTNLNFCDYSNYCPSSNKSILGARIAGGVYIGFEVYGDSALRDCPDKYFMPYYSEDKAKENNSKNRKDVAYSEEIELQKDMNGNAKKCWGNLYVDTDGPKGKGELGKDVFIWGLSENGIVQ